MKTLFDPAVRDELIRRIHSLHQYSSSQWGKMDVTQMAKHCAFWNNWVLGKTDLKYKQEFFGLLFGKMALKSSVKDDKPIGKNMPAGRDFTIKEKGGDVEVQKKIWVGQIAGYGQFSNPAFIHDFFGKMTDEQIGIFAYKHNDHHLRQFGA